MTGSDGCVFLPVFVEKMTKEGLSPHVIEMFSHYYKKAVLGESGLIYENELEKIPRPDVKDSVSLEKHGKTGKSFLKNTVAIVLNGGLGTSMGLQGPKSLVPVKNGKSFLEVIMDQARHQGVTLALMNSYNTHEETQLAINALVPEPPPLYFLQNKFPKILQRDYSPAVCPADPGLEWNPPGHGDLYMALSESGLLDRLIEKGMTYAFVSNSDNLGACVEESLLGYFAENNFPFMMEVSTRTPSDMKGGHLARHKSGHLLLRESAQCPKDEMSAFSDIHGYCFFNTNNLWINLLALKEYIRTHGMLKLPMILNTKTIDPREPRSPKVFQVESAMGSAISLFPGATVIHVPRTRFFPVKKCNDLLAIRSDYYQLTDNHRLVLHPERASDHLRISLDPVYFGKIDEFDSRFRDGVPSLKHCTELHIVGDVRFERDVIIQGKVKIKNSGVKQEVIKAGTVLTSDVLI